MAPFPSLSMTLNISSNFLSELLVRVPKISLFTAVEFILVGIIWSFLHSPLVNAMCIALLVVCWYALSLYAPKRVSILKSFFLIINESFSILYETKSSIEIIFRLNFSATLVSSGRRAIVPSSFKISTKIPAGLNPANLAKSTAASVCPVLLKTPPFFALRGKIWPGLPKLCGLVFGSTKDLIVLARSLTEIPVVHPLPIKSTETVNCVWCKTVLFWTIMYKSNSLHLDSVNGAHIKPLPWVAMKLIISGVTVSAAAIKSPSFSLFSSSTTITTLPFLISSIASSIVFSCTLDKMFLVIIIKYFCKDSGLCFRFT